ncbi:hypothetical protein ElyMa_006063600 [Elysia marginata]|uniref:Uncharacterized protein n=1 Tax=Elysia marginata TaxID=1093978 RepID=A0AAV4GPJ0_9GAST|nr:hypothetical protein ElyMa_006063600 [Elysia marginata]
MVQGVDFIAKDDWPPQSPDLNLMDYAMWDSLAEKVYMGQSIAFTENEIRAKTKEFWIQICIKEVRKSIATGCNIVRAAVQLEGGSTDLLKNLLHWSS